MNKLHNTLAVAALTLAALLISDSAEAHFIWLQPVTSDDGTTTVLVYFGEDASPDDPVYLRRVKDMRLCQVSGKADPQPVQLRLTEKELATGPVEHAGTSLFIASHDLGVMNRGDSVFGLRYYAKTGPAITSDVWEKTVTSDDLRLDIVPRFEGGRVIVTVRFDGEAVEGAQVVASGQGMDDFEGETTSDGVASFEPADSGLYSIRARYIENSPGEKDGQKYAEIRHYTTVAVAIPQETAVAEKATVIARTLPDLPQPVTSFGGAICDGALYVYGGHTGDAHSYSMAEQSNQLWRINLDGVEWQAVAEGPHLQGLALVMHGGKLYRIGGFTAKNAEGEDHSLWSQDSVASFDPGTGEWTELPPLPEPRSSHDAAVVGDTIYVAGGWTLAGEAENVWHDTAWAMDLSKDTLEWKPLPSVPFRRRAVALAAHQDKLYVIGGMQEEGGPTTKTAIFDPAEGIWSEGPVLAAVPEPKDADSKNGESRSRGGMPEGINGFGASAFGTNGRLYVSTIKGTLQRLSEDEKSWEIISRTPTARFFHRLLPVDAYHLLVVGGANMAAGKFEQVEVLQID
ncbi:MAG: hypothetical protein KDA52_11880 [Planctomycetaceae bacterium]|nr:hypothetical protein [Planctomycetaceae bacterium]